MTEAVMLSIITGILSLVSTIFTGIMTYLITKLNMTIKIATTSVDGKLNNLETLGKTTHVLVNSNFGVQLKLNAMLSRELANVTLKKVHEDAAVVSEEAYNRHQVGQSIVDGIEKKEDK